MARTKQTARKVLLRPRTPPVENPYLNAQRRQYADSFLKRCKEWNHDNNHDNDGDDDTKIAPPIIAASSSAAPAAISENNTGGKNRQSSKTLKPNHQQPPHDMYLWDWTWNPETNAREPNCHFNYDMRVGQCHHVNTRDLNRQWSETSLMPSSTATTNIPSSQHKNNKKTSSELNEENDKDDDKKVSGVGSSSDRLAEKKTTEDEQLQQQPLMILQVENGHGGNPVVDETEQQQKIRSLTRLDDGYYRVYTKDQVWFWSHPSKWMYPQDCHGRAIPTWQYGIPPPHALNPGILGNDDDNPPTIVMQNHGKEGMKCDVWTMQCPELIPIVKPLLDEEGKRTMDRPIPRYHNIIDPNLFVRKQRYNYQHKADDDDNKTVWVPSEFDVSSNGDKVTLVGGHRAHWMARELIDGTATPILQRALPLLAKLRKPCLLLEGQRLQVVIKAQRIEVPPAQDEDNPSEYVGLWHVDGEHEAVAAVVLYYYHVHEALEGGNMEFIDRAPIDIFWDGSFGYDPQNGVRRTGPKNYRDTLKQSLNRCSVPIPEAGQMLVFSNYQMAHRVLRMINTSTTEAASRDFMALFILDPATRPLVPARCHLSLPYLYERTLGANIQVGKAVVAQRPEEPEEESASKRKKLERNVSTIIWLNKQCIDQILEFLGLVPTTAERRKTRQAMLLSQLEPKGGLCGSLRAVYTTGNGCFTMLGWFKDLLAENKANMEETYDDDDFDFVDAHKRVAALNRAPKNMGRGLSETLSIPTNDLDGTNDQERSDGETNRQNNFNDGDTDVDGHHDGRW